MASDDSGMRARKPKLAVEEQIAHLKSKGVTFDLCSEGEAAECLSDRTYYFKLAAYRVLFDKRVGGERDGEYVGLDFGHLRDLAAIDHVLRYTLLPMTLNIEHFAKVKLMRELTERSDEDGYSIVENYLSNLDTRDRNLRLGEVSRLKRDRYGGSMVGKYAEDPPALADCGGQGRLVGELAAVVRRHDPEDRPHALGGAERHPHPVRSQRRPGQDRSKQACVAVEDGKSENPADHNGGMRVP